MVTSRRVAGLELFKVKIDRVIELDPDDTETRTMLVFYHLSPKPCVTSTGQSKCAARSRFATRSAESNYSRSATTRRRRPSAITFLLAGIEEYPEGYGFHLVLGNICAEDKRLDAADAEYVAARGGEKDEVYYRSLYGQARIRIQNEFEPERAIELLDEFIAGEPDSGNMQSVAHACWRKGKALEQLGRNQDARDAYEESLRREPSLKLAEQALEGLQE